MDCERILFNEIVGIMQSIVAGEMTRLEQQGKLETITSEGLLRGLSDYGGQLTEASVDDYFSSLNYIRIENTNRYMVYLDFWKDHVRSDLTLICEIGLNEFGGIESSQIENIHVL
jgi:hypothetical protein